MRTAAQDQAFKRESRELRATASGYRHSLSALRKIEPDLWTTACQSCDLRFSLRINTEGEVWVNIPQSSCRGQKI